MDKQYSESLNQEIARYQQIANVHDLPLIFHYWSNKYLAPKLNALGYQGINDFFVKNILEVARHRSVAIKIASIGSGNCDTEIAIATTLLQQGLSDFWIECIDINADMLNRGKNQATQESLIAHFTFTEQDINQIEFANQYDIFLANHSLHHIVNLEQLFNQIHNQLADDGLFLINDMIGRNGHMRWPEAEALVRGIWSLLEERYKYNHQLKRLELDYVNWDCSKEGFEGIRAQDILPLLMKTFQFRDFLGFVNLTSVFIDRSFGHNFNPNEPWDQFLIDTIATLDDYYIEKGIIKPTQMLASVGTRGFPKKNYYKHLTPEFSVRWPDEINNPSLQVDNQEVALNTVEETDGHGGMKNALSMSEIDDLRNLFSIINGIRHSRWSAPLRWLYRFIARGQ